MRVLNSFPIRTYTTADGLARDSVHKNWSDGSPRWNS
jgi:hypothetical protein